jgi:hypothetical protein
MPTSTTINGQRITRERINPADYLHTVAEDPTGGWWVVDADGDQIAWAETEAEARDEARERTDAAVAEAEDQAEQDFQDAIEEAIEDERQELISSIRDGLENLDIKALRKLARKLGL